MSPSIFRGLLFLFVLIALSGNSLAAKPVTGRDWFEAVPEIFSPRSGPGCLSFNRKLWVIGGYDGGQRSDVWSSPDGKLWTRLSGRAFPQRIGFVSAAFNGRIWVLGGYDKSSWSNASSPNIFYDVWSTADGVNWSTSTPTWTEIPGMPPFAVPPCRRDEGGAVAFQGALWFAGGKWRTGTSMLGDIYYNDVWRSTNGVNWQCIVAQAPFAARSGHALVVFNNKLWVIGGHDKNVAYNDVWSSSDGMSWKAATKAASFSPRFAHGCIAFAGKLWVIGGQDQSGKTNNEIWNSPDGVTWQRITPTPAFQPRAGCVCVVHGSQMWLIGGESDGNWHSADGVHWSAEPINHPGTRINQINLAFGGRLWTIGGSDWLNRPCRDAWSSPDGAHWTRVTDSIIPDGISRNGTIGYSFNGAMWLNHYGNLYRSTNGITWTASVLPASIQLVGQTGIALNHKMWLWDASRAWSSVNGVNWTSMTLTKTYGDRFEYAATSFNNKLWIQGGYVNCYRGIVQTLDDIWASDNGKDWIQISSNPMLSRCAHRLESFDGRMWLIGGGYPPFNYSLGLGDVWSSADGVNWIQATPKAAFPGRFGHVCAILNNKLWVLGGLNEDGSLGDVWYTPGINSGANQVQSGWQCYE